MLIATLTATMPEFKTYWTMAITQTAMMKFGEYEPLIFRVGKRFWRVDEVMKVATAITAVLKSTTFGFLVKRIDEQRASAAARITAASTPNKKMLRKINVSDTETWPRAPGILIVILDPIAMVTSASAQNLGSIGIRAKRKEHRTVTKPPKRATAHIYRFLSFWLFTWLRDLLWFSKRKDLRVGSSYY